MKHPLTLEAFADWLERQPPEQQYDYTSCRSCCAFQFLSFVGLLVDSVVPNYWYEVGNIVHQLPPGFEFIAGGHRISNPEHYKPERDNSDNRHTFGAAARRARELLA